MGRKTEFGEPLKNLKQELFCQYYVTKDFFGSGINSYSKAYGIDLSTKGASMQCRANSSRLLKKTEILKRINDLLEHANLNDAFVDREMAFVISQKAELGPKVAAIKEYNRVKKRVEEGLKIDFPHVTKIIINKPKGE